MSGNNTAQIPFRATGPSDGEDGWSCSTVTKVTGPVQGQDFMAEWHITTGYRAEAAVTQGQVIKDKLDWIYCT